LHVHVCPTLGVSPSPYGNSFLGPFVHSICWEDHIYVMHVVDGDLPRTFCPKFSLGVFLYGYALFSLELLLASMVCVGSGSVVRLVCRAPTGLRSLGYYPAMQHACPVQFSTEVLEPSNRCERRGGG
jgi:hypothetical protein